MLLVEIKSPASELNRIFFNTISAYLRTDQEWKMQTGVRHVRETLLTHALSLLDLDKDGAVSKDHDTTGR